MKRVMVMTSLTFLTSALWQVLALNLPYWLNILCLPPIVLAFSLQFFRPLETIWVSLLCGALFDILGGFSVGVNMSLMLVFAFILGTTNLFTGRLSLRDLSIYAGGLSFIYRVVFYVASLIASVQKVNLSIGQLIVGPILDLVVAYVLFLALSKILVALKSFERSDFAKYGAGI